VHFSLRDDNLVVRAQCNQTNDILALIPSSKLRGDLPPAFVDGHVHWLNLSTKIIEIRPLEQLWEQSSENWRIDCASGQYRMYKGRETLVDIRSATWAMASKCFECLNNVFRSEIESKTLLITTSPIDSVQSTSVPRLCVALPRYGLSFFVNETEDLESRDFKDMVYDEDQCVGALFGLENLLVLRPRTRITGALVPEALIPRRILVPNGFPKPHGNHQVRISMDADYLTLPDEPLYHTYDVDTELHCLIGNGNLMSTRFLAYLHATTSCDRPDPLTGETGAQAALCLLHSAGCRSIMKLKAFDNRQGMWTSTKYPQIQAAYQEILTRYYWDGELRRRAEFGVDWCAAQRAAYLFHSVAAVPTSLGDYGKSKYLTTRVPAETGLATGPHTASSFDGCLPGRITLDRLLCSRPAPELPARSALRRDSRNTSSDNVPALDQLFTSLQTDSSFHRAYLARLDTSARCFHAEPQMTHKVTGENRIGALEKHYAQCRVNYLDSVEILKESLGPTTDPLEQALDRLGQWPPITVDVLLGYLASTSRIDISPRWKKCLISLALLLLELQRSRRLLRLALDGLEEEFSTELENEGCDGWKAEEYPDWLLIQVTFFCLNTRLY
jgi:hypothetical protein